MKRREFLGFVGSAAAVPLSIGPRMAWAQPAIPVVGFLSPGSPGVLAHLVDAFRRGLGEAGYVEHRNVGIAYAWAEGQNDRLRALADDLVRARVAVICAAGPPAALAAKAATSAIPIVFTSGEDPGKIGLVDSFNRPGGNVTGVAVVIETLGAKRLGLLREVLPGDTVIAVLLNPNEPTFAAQLQDVREAAQAVGQRIEILRASTEREIDAAFAAAAQLRAGAMLVGISFFYTIRREQLAALAAQASLPTIYGQREFTAAGGLMSYASDLADAYRQAGIYTGRVLKGEKPADLPVQGPVKYELAINLGTARALGLEVPASLLAIADEVIE
jgi:putative tryptophan/tyrosine transport system substrate-binding protein